jgi:hypothetical protein
LCFVDSQQTNTRHEIVAPCHEHPDVLAIWEPMDPLLEDRDGRPKWEFPHYQPVQREA